MFGASAAAVSFCHSGVDTLTSTAMPIPRFSWDDALSDLPVSVRDVIEGLLRDLPLE